MRSERAELESVTGFARQTASKPLSIEVGAVASLGILALATSLLWHTLGMGPLRRAPYILAGVIFACCTVPFIIGRVRGRLDLFEPSIVVCGVWVLSYVIPALSIMSGTDIMWTLWGTRAEGYIPSLVSRALVLSLIGLASFLFAYYVPLPSRVIRVRGPTHVVDGNRFVLWCLLFAGGSLGLFAIFVVRIGGLGVLATNLNDRVRLFSGMNYLIMPVLALLSITLLQYERVLKHGRQWTLGLLLLAIVSFGINTLQGSKTNLLVVVVALVVMRHCLYRPIGVRTAVGLVVFGIIGAVAFDLFFREYLVIRRITSLDLSLRPLEVLRLVWFAFSTNAFVQLQALMLMVDGIPDVLPFQLGRPYIALLLMPIPRAVFPDKPPVGTEIFSRAFFFDFLEQGTSIPTSMVGEFYMNFGAIGVVAGGLIAGFVFRRVYDWMRRNRTEPGVVALYGLVIGTILPWIRGDTFGPTVFFTAVALPMFIITRMSRVLAVSERVSGNPDYTPE